MRAVILASGRSKRLQPVPDKTLLQFCGKTLIEHQVQQLCNHGTTELFIIYGAHNQHSIELINSKLPLKATLVEQEDLDLGMAGAIQSLAKIYPDNKPFLVVSSNDIIADSGFQQIQDSVEEEPEESFLLAKTVNDYFPGGYLELDSEELICSIVEKPGAGNEPSNLVNLVYHYHSQPQKLFTAINNQKSSKDDLYEQALQQLFDDKQNYYALAYTGPWHSIKFPWQIHAMAKYIHGRNSSQIDPSADIAPTAIIEGAVTISRGAKVMHHAVIKGPTYIGPNTIIANNVLVRDSFIGANCVIGYNSEIARSYLQDNVWTHTNYVGDSVIGNNVSFGAGCVTGNLRLDESTVTMNIKGDQQCSGQHKLGLITGDNIRVGIQTGFMPGVKVGSNTMIAANLSIAEDIPEQSFVKGETKLIIKKNNKEIPKR